MADPVLKEVNVVIRISDEDELEKDNQEEDVEYVNEASGGVIETGHYADMATE